MSYQKGKKNIDGGTLNNTVETKVINTTEEHGNTIADKHKNIE